MERKREGLTFGEAFLSLGCAKDGAVKVYREAWERHDGFQLYRGMFVPTWMVDQGRDPKSEAYEMMREVRDGLDNPLDFLESECLTPEDFTASDWVVVVQS
jgi:hypothetical protein